MNIGVIITKKNINLKDLHMDNDVRLRRTIVIYGPRTVLMLG